MRAPWRGDAAHGDYHLARHSLAVDFAPAGGFSSLDLDRKPRDVDQPDVPDRFGLRDVGACENAPLADLVFADGFQWQCTPVPGPTTPDDERHAMTPPAALPLARLLAAAALMLAGPAGAQTCAVPISPMANTTRAVDTCQGDASLQLACGVMPLNGPALVVRLDLPYPAGRINVAPSIGFSPTAFLLRGRCHQDAPCDFAAPPDQSMPIAFDLSTLDSGTYFLVIAPASGTDGAVPCGIVWLTSSIDPAADAALQQGVFHSNFMPVLLP